MARKTPKSVVKKSRKKKQKTNYFLVVSVVVLVLLLIYVIMYIDKIIPRPKAEIIAMVNNESITLSELDNLYKTSVPDELKFIITKEQFLSESLIPQKLLLQEAKEKGITATEEEVDNFLNQFLEERDMTLDEFKSQLKENDIEIKDVRQSFKENIIVTKLINQTIFSGITVTEKEIEKFYNEHEELKNISFEVIKERIRNQLLYDKQSSAFDIYIKQLRKKADIQIFLGKKIISFTKTENEICKQNGKPIIRLFTTTTCTQCEWIKNRFDSVMKEYVKNGKIIAYHWELDTGDNSLTIAKEKGVPKSEVEIFKEYSPKGKIPVYVFGCKYTRIGNYYELEDDLDSEEKEFRLVVEELLE